MEAMDIAVARKLKEVVLSPLSTAEACTVLLDVLESGSFTDTETVGVLLQQAANVVGSRKHLEVFSRRLTMLVERAQRAPEQLKLEGHWE